MVKEYECVVILSDDEGLGKELLLKDGKVIFDRRGVVREGGGKGKVMEVGKGGW